MHKHGKCLWSVKNTFYKAGLSGILLYSWKLETPWSRAEHRFFKTEMMTLFGSMVLSTPIYFLISIWCCLIDFTYSFKGEQSPDNIVQFWYSASRWRYPTFCFPEGKSQKEGKLWCLSGPADFLHFYLNIQLCFFPVSSGPWKLFLIRLCGSKEADPRFIGSVGEPLWQKQFKVTNAKLSADLWKGFLWRLSI